MRTIEEIKADLEYYRKRQEGPLKINQSFLPAIAEIEKELRNALVVEIPIDRLETICAAEKLMGKTVFDTYSGKIKELTVTSYEALGKSVELKCQRGMWQEMISSRLGKTVFLTREEAEAALAINRNIPESQ